MNDTTRRYFRCRNEIPPFRESAIGITGPVVIRTKPPLWVRVLRRCDAWLLSTLPARQIFFGMYGIYRVKRGPVRSFIMAARDALRPVPF